MGKGNPELNVEMVVIIFALCSAILNFFLVKKIRHISLKQEIYHNELTCSLSNIEGMIDTLDFSVNEKLNNLHQLVDERLAPPASSMRTNNWNGMKNAFKAPEKVGFSERN